MTRELKPGQRVRVIVRSRVARYQPGETGTVLRSSVSPTTGERHYTVAMDMDGPAAGGAIFAEGEIEADDES
jgi:hypothetical protein